MISEIVEYFRDRLNRIRLYRPPPERGVWPFIKRRFNPPISDLILRRGWGYS